MKLIILLCFVFVVCWAPSVNSSELLGSVRASCSDKKNIVDFHNELRKQVAQGKLPGQPGALNMNKLIWDDKLAKMARRHSKKMKFEHNKRRKDDRFSVGENLYMGMTTSKKFNGYKWKKAIQSWFDEYKQYTYGSGFSMGTGHYTQLIWADTTHIGCGASYYKDDSGWYTTIYVCNYGPAGNYIGENPYKEGPGCENLSCKKQCSQKDYGDYC